MVTRSLRTAGLGLILGLVLVLLVRTPQVCAAPAPADGGLAPAGVQVLRRTARMTPLWRLMNSKPFGAYCQNNYECSTGICRSGYCATLNRPPAKPVTY